MKKTIKWFSFVLALLFTALCFTSCGAGSTEAIMMPLAGDALQFDDSRGVSVHDPSIYKAKDGTYYITGSHIASAESTDLIHWQTISAGVFDSNRTLVAEGSTLRKSFGNTQTTSGRPMFGRRMLFTMKLWANTAITPVRLFSERPVRSFGLPCQTARQALSNL